MSLHYLFLVPLITLLLVTSHGDLLRHRIRNVWTLGGASFALLLHLGAGGFDGLQVSLLGLTTGLGLFLPLYIFGGMAAGDVKLMAAVGALLGSPMALPAVVCTLITGGFMGVAYLAIRGELGRWLRRWSLSLAHFTASRNFAEAYFPPAPHEVAGQRFPYALSIAVGSLLAVMLFGNNAPDYMQGIW